MIRIIFQREKCIGCNACTEAARYRWRLSRKDGKSILLDSIKKRNFYISIIGDDEWDANKIAAESCPVKIIKLEKI
ncbi:MAG: ferredoxin [Bacteroidetes bacterium]|nr:ferredoxin [Bacteroidota bacterium]